MTYLVLNYSSSVLGEYPGISTEKPTNSFDGEKRKLLGVSTQWLPQTYQ